MGIHIHQNAANCALKVCPLYCIYSLCINKVDLKIIPILVCIKRNILSQSGKMLVLLKMNEVAMATHSLEALEKAEG